MATPYNTGRKRSFESSTSPQDVYKKQKQEISYHGRPRKPENTGPPREIKVYKFAEARGTEINSLLKNVKNIFGNRVIFQKLPRHMRRRAMSHSIKRLPRRVREAALAEYKDRPQAGGKRPSRKYRRRPKHLHSEYVRRQRRIKWLETHIWHAKRFHMTEKWGYKLPVRPTDRSYRACYRASTNHCLLQDVSYECCMEVNGEEKLIVETLKHMLKVDTGSTVGGAAVIKGNRIGENMLYHYDNYPNKAIGHVSFLWKPYSDMDKGRQLWLWCHPSCYDSVWSEIICAFQADNVEIETIERREFSPFDKKVKVGEIQITSLKDYLVKFRLTGPLSQTILMDALKPANVTTCSDGNHWWQMYYKKNQKQHINQISMWEDLKTCQSPAEAPPNIVLSLTVRDPRLFMPEVKTKLKPMLDGLKTTDVKTVPSIPDTSQSPLWNSDIRKEVKADKLSEADLNKMRSSLIIPGSIVELGDQESRIPVILIQKPGVRDSTSHKLGYGSGWDVILPSGWGMAFHLAFVYRGCRTGGLQEAESIVAEMGRLYSPLASVDTSAGRLEQTNLASDLMNKYRRYPPNKRPNFVKLGVSSPFSCPWEDLVAAWKTTSQSELTITDNNEGVYVLRNKKQLRLLAKVIDEKSKHKTNFKGGNFQTKLEELQNLSKMVSNCLVPIQMTMNFRGLPVRCAHVSIPNMDDLDKLSGNSKYGGPKEKPCKDPSKVKIKGKPRSTTQFTSSDRVDINVNDRKLIGYLNSGRFVFGQGHGSGVAFCSLIGLLELIRSVSFDRELCVLVRNPTSLQYRFANISVVV